MTTLIQPVSNVNGAITITPLYGLGSAAQIGTVTSSAIVTPSSITTLGATSDSAVTYDAISLLQSFTPTFSVSGLTTAQQQQLALALGLSANATSTDLTNAINALLTPANPADALVNVLVGGATTETTNSVIPSFLNTNGEIAGVPGTTASQVSDSVFATLLDTGTTTATTSSINTIANNAQAITVSPSAVSTNQAASVAPAVNTNPIQGNVPATNLNIATTEYLATAATTNTTNTAVNSAQVISGNSSSISTNQVVSAAPAATEAAINLTNPALNNTQGVATPYANTGQVQGNFPTTNSNIATSEYLATAALNIPTAATAVINVAAAPVTLPNVNTAQAQVVANIATVETGIATVTAATAAAITAAATANATANLLAENTLSSVVVSLPATQVTTTGNQTTPTITPTVTQTSATAAAVASAATGVTTVSILPPTTATPVATTSTVNTTSNTFDNADSMLQALLVDAASHDLITANQAEATYAIPGTVYQLSSGVDHTRQADLTGNLPDIRDTLNPVSRVAAVRGTLKRQT